MPWTPQSLTWLGIADDGTSEGDILTALVGTPAGVLVVMGEVEFIGRVVNLRNAHIHIEGAGANKIGLVNLRTVAAFVLERIECDEARVEGAVRTTGANPGHRPRVMRFTRKPRVATS
jgi:hypothetical protein